MVACETKCVPKGFAALCESASKTQEKKSRKQQRQSRAGVPTIGIVGYTNAGTRNARGEDVAKWMEDASGRFLLGNRWPYLKISQDIQDFTGELSHFPTVQQRSSHDRQNVIDESTHRCRSGTGSGEKAGEGTGQIGQNQILPK